MPIEQQNVTQRPAWNTGRLIGPKPPLKPRHIWAIRTRLQHDIAYAISPCSTWRSTVSFAAATSLALDQRCCPRRHGETTDFDHSAEEGRPVPFELTDPTREALTAWLRRRPSIEADWLFPSRSHKGEHVTTRQYGRLLDDWVSLIGLDPALYGTHSLRRTKVALIYKRTGNLRACQLLLGHSKLESTVRYLGIEVDDALILSEQTDI